MNTIKVYLFLMFILAEYTQKGMLVHSSETKRFTFRENIKSCLETTDKLFTALQLKEKTTNIKLLLNIHKNLLKVMEMKTKQGDKIPEADNKTLNLDTNAEDIALYELLQDFTFPFMSTSRINENNVTEELLQSIHDSLLNISKFNMEFNMGDITNYTNITAGAEEEELNWESFENNTNPVRRIYDSKPTNIKFYPFMVSVHLGSEFVCSGAIIKKAFVITAASCLHSFSKNKGEANLKNLVVRAGSIFSSYGGALVSIKKVFIHPQFNPSTLKNNLAILRMGNTVKKAGKKLKISRIAIERENSTFISSILMLGWGATTELNQHMKFQKLSYAYLDLYDLNDCKEVYSHFYVNDMNFCAGSSSKGSGACIKDIGDPAVVNGALVGVVSYGPPLCGTADAPTVFTTISYYAQWIDSITKMPEPSPAKPGLRMRPPTIATARTKPTTQTTIPHLKPVVDDYPEEIEILQIILRDLAENNGSLIDEVIDESFDKEILNSIMSTTKTDLLHHPLINKSIVPIVGVHIPKEKDAGEYHTVRLTTSKVFTYPWQQGFYTIPDPIVNYDAFAEEFELLHTVTVPTLPLPKLPPKTTRYVPPTKHSTDIFYYRIGSMEDTYGSNSDESSGLSIEMTTAKMFDESRMLATKKSAFDSSTKYKDLPLLYYKNRDHNGATKTDTKVYFNINGKLMEMKEFPFAANNQRWKAPQQMKGPPSTRLLPYYSNFNFE